MCQNFGNNSLISTKYLIIFHQKKNSLKVVSYKTMVKLDIFSRYIEHKSSIYSVKKYSGSKLVGA